CGGSSETLGVNWHAQAAIVSSVPCGSGGKESASQSMARPFHRQGERRGRRSAAPLEDLYTKRIACAFERQAQRRGRRAVRGFGWAEQRHPGPAALRGASEAAQVLIAPTRKPGDERVTDG